MNKNLYRLIFNKARGMLMVVPEIARSGRAGSSPSSGTGHTLSQLIGKVQWPLFRPAAGPWGRSAGAGGDRRRRRRAR